VNLIPNPGHTDPFNYTTEISESILDLFGKQFGKLLTHYKWQYVRKIEKLKNYSMKKLNKDHK